MEALLKQHGLRLTKGRVTVLQTFLQSGKALSHSDLSDLLGNKYDRVTIYRILQSFEAKGLVHKVPDDQVSVKYALCDSGHTLDHAHSDNHAHFKCHTCGDTVCLEQSSIPKVNIPKGFKIKESFLLLEGQCDRCNV